MSYMRSRGGRPRSGGRPQYEDFTPASEWNYEQGVSILLFHLPGFKKEEIRIISENGVLRVRGERHGGGNKWIRFQEEVVVPQDCKTNEIRAKFEAGILRISMPKNIINPSTNQEHSKTKEPTAPKPQDQLHQEQFPKPTLPSLKHPIAARKPENLPEATVSAAVGAPAKPENLPEATMTAAAAAPVKPEYLPRVALTKPKKLPEATVSAAVAAPAKPENLPEATASAAAAAPAKPKALPEANLTAAAAVAAKPENLPRAALTKPENSPEAAIPSDVVDQEKTSMNELDRFGIQTGVKMPLLQRLDEDRKLLVNMGAAVLVIVALGSYIANSFAPGSSG
ncbi:unnamed protein product [Amaranthus hypochondriacus]